MAYIRLIRIFLSSPGDVSDERGLALEVIDQLQYDPNFRGRVAFEVVAWDKPGTDTPMLATMTPQAAIDAGLPQPGDCDIVVVLFWSRMGTPLPHPEYQKLNGEPYYSGTEWEFEAARRAALNTGKPYVVVYQRTEEPVISLDDPDLDKKIDQRKRVKTFFNQFTDTETGAIYGGINSYMQPDNFRDKLETHLKVLIHRLLEEPEAPLAASPDDDEAPLWQGSPFPGLRAFTSADAPIFFGRGAETDRLVKRLSEPGTRLVAVVGASGAGKSSLVGAGLIPRLQANAIEGSKDWLLPTFDAETGQWAGVRLTPGEVGDNPFMALAVKLGALLRQSPRDLADRLENDPNELAAISEHVLNNRPDWAELLLFIDQFEELFTLVQPRYIAPFVTLLNVATRQRRLRTVLTLRADFYARCVEVPALATLLEATTYPLPTPTQVELNEMIVRPAERAGLAFESGLPERILRDTGDEPGKLALMAYALDELYRVSQDDRVLNLSDYEALGGVQGAIGERAENIFRQLKPETQATLPTVFQELTEVDERGVAIRNRAPRNIVARNDMAADLVDALTDARLLVQSRTEGDEPVVEVAHEALLRSWHRLARWIDQTQDVLRLRRQVRVLAEEWRQNDRHDDYLLRGDQLGRVKRSLSWASLSREEQAYVVTSVAYENQLTEREERRKYELQEAAERAEQATRQAQQTAAEAENAQSRARRITRLASGAIAILTLVAIGAGVLTINANNSVTDANNQIAQLEDIAPAATNAFFMAPVATNAVVIAPAATNALMMAPAATNAPIMAPVATIFADHLDFHNKDWEPKAAEFGGVEMVQVLAGCFIMGSLVQPEVGPIHEQCIEDHFWIDRFEVTNEQFGSVAERCERGSSQPEEPRTCVTWFEAQEHCAGRDARLPTEAEWEYAARGPDSWMYPWGNVFIDENVIFQDSPNNPIATVGSRPAGASWVGAVDMSGNVREWVSTVYDQDKFPYPYDPVDGREGLERTDVRYVLRGGSFLESDSRLLRTAYRGNAAPEERRGHFGFRCARSE